MIHKEGIKMKVFTKYLSCLIIFTSFLNTEAAFTVFIRNDSKEYSFKTNESGEKIIKPNKTVQISLPILEDVDELKIISKGWRGETEFQIPREIAHQAGLILATPQTAVEIPVRDTYTGWEFGKPIAKKLTTEPATPKYKNRQLIEAFPEVKKAVDAGRVITDYAVLGFSSKPTDRYAIRDAYNKLLLTLDWQDPQRQEFTMAVFKVIKAAYESLTENKPFNPDNYFK